MKKPFSETKVGSWIKDNAPQLIDTVKDFIPSPLKGGLSLVKMLVSNIPGMAAEKITEFNQLADEHEVELQKLYNEEMANARNREIEITKTLGKKDMTLTILAFMGVSFPVLIISYLILYGLADMKPDVAMLVGGLIGIIVGEYKTVFNYFFGSSSGSKAKQNTIDTIIGK